MLVFDTFGGSTLALNDFMARYTFFLLTLYAIPVVAQHDAAAIRGDTVTTARVVVIDPGVSLGRPLILLPPLLEGSLMLRVPASLQPGRPASLMDPWYVAPVVPKADLLSPLRLQQQRDEEMKTLRMILGTVQLGGVAYIAYRHVTKYGFR